jgi:two-component system LytT family sensor kinase
MSKLNWKLRPVLLHIFFWICFLALPLLLGPNSASNNPREIDRHFQWNMFFVVFGLFNIPLFYFNTEFLLRKILKKRGVLIYIILLVISLLVMLWFHEELFKWFFPEMANGGGQRGNGFRRGTSLRIIFQLLFIVAIGISYRFLSDNMTDQEVKKEEENERLKSELSFLRSQISPHFMFNVLNSIVSLSRRKPEMVEPVVIKLSELMRYMIYETSDSKVSIDKEFSYLESYIELQRLRFGNDIKIDFKHNLSSSPSSIEPMLLIPFVENAFKHGVGMVQNPSIDIELNDDKKSLFFSVRNQVSKQNSEIKDESSGIGLANVRRRLELLYPDQHELKIDEKEDSYLVELTIKHI